MKQRFEFTMEEVGQALWNAVKDKHNLPNGTYSLAITVTGTTKNIETIGLEVEKK